MTTSQPWVGYVPPNHITCMVGKKKNPQAVNLVQSGCRLTVFRQLVEAMTNILKQIFKENIVRNIKAHRETAESRNQPVNIS